MSVLDAPALVEPRWFWVPDYVHTYGPEVADLADLAGMPLDPEQKLLLDAMYGVDKNGRLVCYEFGVVCARQNLKTHALEFAQLSDSFQFNEPLSIWTAHLFDTAQEAFRDLDQIIAGTPFLAKRVLKVNRANGDEGFELKSGARLKVKARSKSGGRGLTGDRVTLDEAFALSSKEMGALLPTLSARPNPQVRYGSSAGLEDSAVLRGIRDRGRAGNDPTLGYIEWASEEDSCTSDTCSHELGTAGCALDDIEKIREANPALGRRIDERTIRAERRALVLEPEEFARERLGWFSSPGLAVMPYSVKAWKDLTEPGSLPAEGSTPIFGLDVNPSRSRAAIGGCASREDGLGHVELQEYQSGTGRIVDTAVALAEKHGAEFVILGDGAAESLIPELEDRGVTVRRYNASQYAAACGLFGDQITAKTIRHIGQDEITDAIEMARKRERDGVWTLTRKGGDIAPLVATLLPVHAWVTDNTDYPIEQSIL